MVLKSIAILSHKGGVGKTSISVNLAVHLAKAGKNVCLLEHDFHGPSLITFFKPEATWINEYINGEEEFSKCIQDYSATLKLPGKLFICFADPTPESIQKVIQIDQKSSFKMLRKLMNAKKLLKKKPYDIEYLIIDCSPGIGFSSVNVMLVADSSLFIVKLSNADLMGTSQMLSGLYKQLKNRTLVLGNMIPEEAIENKKKRTQVQKLIEKRFQQDIGEKVVEFMGWIPTDLELQKIEFNEAIKALKGHVSSRTIYTLEQPDHIFSTTLQGLVPSLFGETQK